MKNQTMKYLFFILSFACCTALSAQVFLPSTQALDSVDVIKIKPGAGSNEKATRIRYVSYTKTPFGIDTSSRLSPPLDSTQLETVADEAANHIFQYYQRAADATYNVYTQIQRKKGTDSYEKIFSNIRAKKYEDVLWERLKDQLRGKWVLIVSDKELIPFEVNDEGKVTIEDAATPKSTKKNKEPSFKPLADVRIVVSGIVNGNKDIAFDFVARDLYWNIETGYFLQKLP